MRLDTWDTDYISDNGEQQYLQLHFDLWIKSGGDSIRNSCDVCNKRKPKFSIFHFVNPAFGELWQMLLIIS